MKPVSDSKYNSYKEIDCACGCGGKRKERDRYGRLSKYITGHNTPRKYNDPTQYKREWNHRNRPARAEAKMVRYRRLKAKIIGIKGSKCQKCNLKYNGKNAPVFEFHHRDPKTKEFQLTHMLVNKAWESVLEELKKCDLLCSNCHNQIHSVEF